MSVVKYAALGTKFFVILSGKTNGAHQPIIKKLEDIGQTEVDSFEQCDYLLVFCPITSRVGTDINETLSKISDVKKAILVVMHHTFNPSLIVADSRRQVQKPNILLTVDCLFYEGKLLKCNRNNNSMTDIERVVGTPVSWITVKNAGWKNILNRLKIPLLICSVILIVLLPVIIWRISATLT